MHRANVYQVIRNALLAIYIATDYLKASDAAAEERKWQYQRLLDLTLPPPP